MEEDPEKKEENSEKPDGDKEPEKDVKGSESPESTQSDEQEEVKEIFNVTKDGEEKTVETEGEEKIPEVKEGQVKSENKILKGFLIVIGIIVLFTIVVFFVINSVKFFEYKGTNYEIIKEGSLIFYRTAFPVINEGVKNEYNIYIRNDPRDLERRVPLDGEFIFMGDIVLDSKEDFSCAEEGIAVANFLKLQLFDTQIIKNENLTCDSNGNYLHITLQAGNETSIVQTGPTCYNFNINNCEILDVTERYMVEAFARVNNYL